MAGIYFHIPFCRQACYYCDFHFSTLLKNKEAMVNALLRELDLRAGFLSGETVESIYFGGGTPSLLTPTEIMGMIDRVYRWHEVSPSPEITLEANPDDLNDSKLLDLKSAGVNRLSIGVQSFNNSALKYLHRVHDGKDAMDSLNRARRAGFGNINTDIIYAIKPGHMEVLKKDLSLLKSLRPEHISAYCLTIEPDTVFGRWYKKGKLEQEPDEEAAMEYEYLIGEVTSAGYDHYEISNFSIEGYASRHNSGYWLNRKYLGLGPSAHSYDGHNRYSNLANNALYMKSIRNAVIPESIDYLSDKERINEYLMISLRTKWGCDLSYLNAKFGYSPGKEKKDYMAELEARGYITIQEKVIRLTLKGKLIADKIAEELFIP